MAVGRCAQPPPVLARRRDADTLVAGEEGWSEGGHCGLRWMKTVESAHWVAGLVFGREMKGQRVRTEEMAGAAGWSGAGGGATVRGAGRRC